MTGDAETPFESVVEPLAARCLARLNSRLGAAGSPGDLAFDEAFTDLAKNLREQLATISSRVLYDDFASARSREGVTVLDDSADSVYAGRARALRAGDWTRLLTAYPELSRLIDVVTTDWEDATAEFVRRIDADRPLLQGSFGGGTSPGRVTRSLSGLSDRHHHGRTVCSAAFESGLVAIYKPRDVAIEAAFAGLVDWLNDRGLEPPLRAVRTLERVGYGWSEFIPATECADEAAAKRYFVRSGMFACLLHVLGATDMHHGNLVACGEYPMLVDLETLFHPLFASSTPGTPGPSGKQGGQGGRAAPSLLRTGLTPFWTPAPDGSSYDVSGLGALSARATRVPRRTWHHPGTDAMTEGWGTVFIPVLNNVPMLDGLPLAPSDFSGEIIDGYARAHLFLEAHRPDLVAPSGPLAAMAGCRTRALLRDTHTYRMWIERTLAPSCLRDVRDRLAELERLLDDARARTATATSLDSRLEDAECDTLLRLDIPSFSTRPDATWLETEVGVRIASGEERSPYERAVAQLKSLDDAELERNAQLLRATLALAGLERMMVNPG